MYQFLISGTTDPSINIAIEEYLFEELSEPSLILFLYVNSSCVIIGRNQNPWCETDPKSLRENDVGLFRRNSGGGAVYHDSGNLVYSFIGTEDCYNTKEQFKMVQDALKNFNIHAERKNNIDLMVNDKKISGNSFYLRGFKKIHHGTLLLDSELSDLEKYLKPAIRDGVTSHAIKSRRASVMNLKMLNKKIDTFSVTTAIVEEYIKAHPEATKLEFNDVTTDTKHIGELREKHLSFKWVIGKTPKFLLNGKEIDPDEWGSGLTPLCNRSVLKI